MLASQFISWSHNLDIGNVISSIVYIFQALMIMNGTISKNIDIKSVYFKPIIGIVGHLQGYNDVLDHRIYLKLIPNLVM